MAEGEFIINIIIVIAAAVADTSIMKCVSLPNYFYIWILIFFLI